MTSQSDVFQSSSLLPNPSYLTKIRSILRSNTVPEDTAVFRRVVDEAPSELVRYDAEIFRVQNILDKLVSERAVLTEYVNSCQSLFAPVRRLPPELLVEIFDACTPRSALDLLFGANTPAEELNRINVRHVLQLSQVCFHWHAVAMHTARLWSWIVTDTSFWVDSALDNVACVDLLETSLARGGSHPLVLRAVVLQGHPDRDRIMDALVKHTPRWRDLYLCCFMESFSSMTAVGDLPLLERLTICNHGGGMNMTFFEGAPLLKDVVFIGSFSNIPSLPWAQLRSFRYRDDDASTSDLGAILSLLSRLSTDAHFSFCMEIMATEPADLPPIVSHVSGFGLELSGSEDGDAGQVTQALWKTFQALTLSQLKELNFERDWFTPSPRWNHDEFLAFSSRSSLHKSLTALDIHIIISDEELLRCLAAVPLLNILGISDCSGRKKNILITDNLLRRLAWRADDSCLIPNLHLIFISSLFTFSDDAFYDFLTSRLVPGRRHAPRSEPFQARVCWLARREREVSAEVSARITGFMEKGELGYRSAQDPDEPFDDPYYYTETSE
ncbi:hypothetical protein C8R45DRAFT_989063 [Mycena sanguinolenta]|nr:hypothetical protein C8R45DRAFT_989063 [Mycena sanguinolenta]